MVDDVASRLTNWIGIAAPVALAAMSVTGSAAPAVVVGATSAATTVTAAMAVPTARPARRRRMENPFVTRPSGRPERTPL